MTYKQKVREKKLKDETHQVQDEEQEELDDEEEEAQNNGRS
jgi:hypothetical protein